MSQDAPGTPTTFVMAATLTSEADLKAWYLANNPTLRSHGLSCPKALYKEMKRDLRGRFRTTVAIVPASAFVLRWLLLAIVSVAVAHLEAHRMCFQMSKLRDGGARARVYLLGRMRKLRLAGPAQSP